MAHDPIRLFGAVLLGVATLSCATATRTRSTSVVDFLYPGVDAPRVETDIPHLRLPLRVGIAFVPAGTAVRGRGARRRPHPQVQIPVVTEQQRLDLLRRIARQFEELDFVASIEEIPTAYLRPGGGFENLDQLSRLYGIDVVTLLSYDQAQFTDEGWDSIGYWTLVGVYVLPAERNATHTLLDAAVFDIASRKLLFRAPGTSTVEGRATPVNLSEELRRDAGRGFERAAEELVANLDTELVRFQERVKQQPQAFRVSDRQGGTWAGGGGAGVAALAVLIAAATLARDRRH